MNKWKYFTVHMNMNNKSYSDCLLLQSSLFFILFILLSLYLFGPILHIIIICHSQYSSAGVENITLKIFIAHIRIYARKHTYKTHGHSHPTITQKPNSATVQHPVPSCITSCTKGKPTKIICEDGDTWWKDVMAVKDVNEWMWRWRHKEYYTQNKGYLKGRWIK